MSQRICFKRTAKATHLVLVLLLEHRRCMKKSANGSAEKVIMSIVQLWQASKRTDGKIIIGEMTSISNRLAPPSQGTRIRSITVSLTSDQ